MDSELPARPRVDIVLLNFRAAAVTCDCLNSLTRMQTGMLYKVWVVDNASGDDSRAVLQQWLQEHADRFPLGATWIGSPCNLGFAGGNNLALQEILTLSTTDEPPAFVWMLNNDTLVEPDTLDKLVQGVQKQRLDLAGNLLLLHPSGQVQAYGGKVCRWTGASRFLQRPEDVAAMDYAVGASLLVSILALQRTGLLPEDYFLYSEEADFCMGAVRKGLRLGCITDAIVHHRHGVSTGGGARKGHVPYFSDCLMVRNRFLLACRYLGRVPACIGLSLALLNRLKRAQFPRVRTILNLVLRPRKLETWLRQHANGYLSLPAEMPVERMDWNGRITS